MAEFKSTDIFVVASRYRNYNGPPDVVYTSRDDADKAAEELNEWSKTEPSFRGVEQPYFVQSLHDRVNAISDASRNEREHGSGD